MCSITSLNNFLWLVLHYYKCKTLMTKRVVGCRKALANALAAAPSMWTLGNAGMGALQVINILANLALDNCVLQIFDCYRPIGSRGLRKTVTRQLQQLLRERSLR